MTQATKPKGQAQPLSAEQLSAIRMILQSSGRFRDLALLNVAIDTMLRISDVLGLKVGDVTDCDGEILNRIVVRQQKTQEVVNCVVGPKSKAALQQYIASMKCSSARAKLFDISPRQAQRLVKQWMKLIHTDGRRFSPHSLRRTKASHIYKQTKNVEIVRQLLGHHSISATSHYLGIEVDEALETAERFDI